MASKSMPLVKDSFGVARDQAAQKNPNEDRI
jgi:hypothetical protein